MIRYVGRFGHAAKIYTAILIAGFIGLILLGPQRFDGGLPGYFGVLALWAVVGGAQLWIQMSQRVWWNEVAIFTKILGGPKRNIMFSQISEVRRSHSWKRALNERKPLDEIVIISRDGAELPISLRHQKIDDLSELLWVIRERTGLPIPALKDLK